MLELLGTTARKGGAIAQAEVRTIIEHRDVGLAEQAGNGAERAAEPAVEKHGVLAPEELRHLPLELAVKIGHAREHRRAAGAEAVGGERFLRGGDDLGVIREPEVIVGAKIDHRLRLAVVGDAGASLGRGAHFRLVEFDGPRACFHPTRETCGDLQRVAAFTREKIPKTEVGRILAHKCDD